MAADTPPPGTGAGPGEPDAPLVYESTKHGARTDDRLAGRDAPPEGVAGTPDVPGEPGSPELRARPEAVDDANEGPRERALRQELLRLVGGASYPADRNDLLRHLGPDERGPVHAHLRALPPDLVFSSPEEVATAFGAIHSTD